MGAPTACHLLAELTLLPQATAAAATSLRLVRHMRRDDRDADRDDIGGAIARNDQAPPLLRSR